MLQRDVHQCECLICQQEMTHPDQVFHCQMNLLFSRLDEQQHCWYVAVESNRLGVCGDQLLSQIPGIDLKKLFNVAGRNWRPGFPSDQSGGYDYLAVGVLVLKKRSIVRSHAGSISGAGDGG